MLSVSCARISPGYFETFYSDRQQHIVELAAHERAPLSASDLGKITYYAYDNDYRLNANFTPSQNAQPFDMATYSGKVQSYIDRGTLTFSINGDKHVLHVYQNVRYMNHPLYGNYYFIPFKDWTNGSETYGGGRYINMEKSAFEKNRVLIDLNSAYNPWCAYADGYNCPIPPNENHLAVAIPAGEKAYQKAKE